MPRHTTLGRTLGVIVGLATALLAPWIVAAPARAADVQAANALYADIAPNLRSDKILLPAIAGMDARPKGLDDRHRAALLPAGKPGWDEAASWAQKAPQQAALTALKSVTGARDWRKAHAFGLPYGVDGIEPRLVRANLYVDLGDPPLLAAAKYGYIEGLDALAILANVEATRLARDGKPNESLQVLAALLYLGRQMVDRQMSIEAKWGLDVMAETYERLRDVIYTDRASATPALTAENLKDLLGKLDVEDAAQAYVSLDRAKFPQGDLIAAEQLIERVFDASGGPDGRTFASTMSRLGANQFPLRLFCEAGKWAAVMGMQAPRDEQLRKARGLHQDGVFRWPLSRFDPSMSRAWEVQKLDKTKNAVAAAAVPDYRPFFAQRVVCIAEERGTRSAIGAVGFAVEQRQYPPTIAAIRPRWVKNLDDDPMNTIIKQPGGKGPYGYFIPDAKGLEMEVVVGRNPPFSKLIKNDTFVMYSLGGDHADRKAKRVQNTEARTEIAADYLIWPPLLALEREHVYGN